MPSQSEGSSAAPTPTATPSPSSQAGAQHAPLPPQAKGETPVTPQPTPGEKKSGTLQEVGQGGDQAEGRSESESDEKNDKGMSRHQAEGLLRSVEEEEQQVKFQQRGNMEEVTKDW